MNGKKWKDILPFKFTTNEGYLTDDAKEFMKLNGLRTLDEALNFVEIKGFGYWYSNDLARPDVKYSGHVAHAVNAL